jgi:hypothetical protein
MAASVVLIGFEDIAEAKPEIYLCDPSGTLSKACVLKSSFD